MGMKKTDDVVGKWGWTPLYRFIVISYFKKNKRINEVVHIVDDPITAYVIYLEMVKRDEGTLRGKMMGWLLYDSYNRDALEFCKQKAENPILDLSPPEEEVEKI